MKGIQRYKQVQKVAEDGWARSVRVGDMVKDNYGEWCMADEALEEWRRLIAQVSALRDENSRLKRS